uniref:protein-serine/threonine phosphatase n=1 Tax=Aegilops tauschii subsp. strangulata TaxID=200361 RepID=A0A453I944_AEGTS
RPLVRYGHSGFAKRGEDYFLVKPDCLRIPGDPSSAFSVFAVFDGHNGVSAAVFSKEHLLDDVMSAVPQGISREDWLQVGDSRCILDTQGGVVSLLTVDHRLEENVEERERVTASGGEVSRLNVGPLRCWPGGLCLSRSIGDTDVGEFIVPIPHVKQVKLSNAGGRLIIASDGIWDAVSSEIAAQACRGLPAELAAKLVVKVS